MMNQSDSSHSRRITVIAEGTNAILADLPPTIITPHPRFTSVDDYVRFRHVRRFVQDRYDAIPRSPGKHIPVALDDWLTRMGRTNRYKFIRRLGEWADLRDPVPLKFLELIGISRMALLDVAKLDLEDYKDALALTNRPLYFQYRVMACVYPVVKLPVGITEGDAILHVQQFLEAKLPHLHAPACIYYGDIKRIWISIDSYRVDYYPPEIVFRNDFAYFENRDRNIGVARIH